MRVNGHKETESEESTVHNTSIRGYYGKNVERVPLSSSLAGISYNKLYHYSKTRQIILKIQIIIINDEH